MGVHNNVPFLQKEPGEEVSGEGLLKASPSPTGPKSPSTPLTPRLSRETSIRRNYSITAKVTVAVPAYSTLPAVTTMTSASSLSSTMVQEEQGKTLDANADSATQEFHGDIKVSASLPSKSTLEKIADLPVFDVDGKSLPFKSLYWPEAKDKKKVMIIFIRHFFCGVSIVLLPRCRHEHSLTPG
jgi:hypothetical protein